MKDHKEYHSYPIRSRVLKTLEISPVYNYSDPANARDLSYRLNQSSPFSSAEISAVGLLGQAARQLILHYQQNQNPALLQDFHSFTKNYLKSNQYQSLVNKMLSSFPPESYYLDPELAKIFLFEDQDSRVHQLELLLGLFLVGLANENPAFSPDQTLFRDLELVTSVEFQIFFNGVPIFFDNEPQFHGSNLSLLEALRAPWKSSPDSLAKQLDYVLQNWFVFLDEDLRRSLVMTLDVIQEENQYRAHGPGPARIPDFKGPSYDLPKDFENFSEDLDWMPRTVLIAKNVFVWLDQLSKKHMSSITTLDQIPRSELAILAERGITSLWLIGLWERSTASQRIKQLCGNQDAIPSAYSLYDYKIAAALGGETAYQKLFDLSKSCGIRLAADMVPNHVGLSSKWVYEHPDWFISLDHSPFPSYTFQGENLSENPDFSIQIEDHYYDKTDAAVVFKHHSHKTDRTRFIYHGNDGTSMPWNDTAQLNYLNSEVREAVIQTILHVAKKFSIIRFDAAMTLTKKHFQRLWFPEPGSGGAIPSRSEHGLNKSAFDKAMPLEFWREVVDRVAAEAPDTLLLAEAFWMMEGFFVRTLGMHRVYNSAFMHMLRDEKNQDYRLLLKKTLEYDSQILKRYVNFMNNPDEETAIAQFGNDGKYFGVCTLMATIPGLPMFGHGQIEGYTEKYGMEYRRAYYNETPDQILINRHKREIFPLLKKRYLFAEVDNFYLYDFKTSSGSISEDVICYSNQYGNEKAFVIYHNKWADVEGAVTKTLNIANGSKNLCEALSISPKPDAFLLYREHISGLEFLIPTDKLYQEGLYFKLGAYEYRVLWDFSVVEDHDGTYNLLHQSIGNSGVPSLEDQRRKIKYRNSSCALLAFLSSAELNSVTLGTLDQKQLEKLYQDYNRFLESVAKVNFLDLSPDEITSISIAAVNNFTSLQRLLCSLAQSELISGIFSENSPAAALIWPLVESFKNILPVNDLPNLLPSSLLEAINRLLPAELASDTTDIHAVRSLTRSLFALPAVTPDESLIVILEKVIKSENGKTLLKIHPYQGVDYFHKESFSDLAGFLTILKLNEAHSEIANEASQDEVYESHILETCHYLINLAEKTDYQIEIFLSTARSELGDSQ